MAESKHRSQSSKHHHPAFSAYSRDERLSKIRSHGVTMVSCHLSRLDAECCLFSNFFVTVFHSAWSLWIGGNRTSLTRRRRHQGGVVGVVTDFDTNLWNIFSSFAVVWTSNEFYFVRQWRFQSTVWSRLKQKIIILETTISHFLVVVLIPRFYRWMKCHMFCAIVYKLAK